VRPLERLLTALWVPEHAVQLLLATPALRASWLLSVLAVLGFAVAAAYGEDQDVFTLVFLALAPVLPLAGVATAYGAGIDPTYELTVAAPMSGFRLLLLRTSAVLVATIPIVGLASVAMPGVDPGTAAWLLPSFALTTTSLALSARLGPVTAATAVTAGWLWLVAATADPHTATALPFSAGGQIASALAGAVAIALLMLQRHRFERGGTTFPRRPR
jgi:hypothetical protein